jgi:tellurite methyltransferase
LEIGITGKKNMPAEATLLNPEPSLTENIKYFQKGSVLDIACGDGRNTLFLLENGFTVTGMDYSETALKRLKMFAAEKDYHVNTKQVDLYHPGALKEVGIFDNIVVNHFRLKKEQMSELKPSVRQRHPVYLRFWA